MVKSVYVPEAGGILDFADDITPQEISSYINAKYPRAAAPAAAPTPDESTVSQRLAYGLMRGITDIPGGIASLMYPEAEAAQTAAGRWSAGNRAYLQKQLNIDPTKEPSTAQYLAETLGSAASFLVPGTAVAKGAKLLGTGAKLAAGLGTGTATAQGIALGAGSRADQIRQQLESGMEISEEDQLAAQRLSGLIGASEAIPMAKFFGPLTTILSKVPASKAAIVQKIVSNRLAKVTRAGVEEAAQEVASGIANDLMEYGVYNPDVQIGQDLLSNAAGGAFAGSTLEGIIQLAAGRKLRGARQLQKDLDAEKQTNAAELRQAYIAQDADNLLASGVRGEVSIAEEEDPAGFTKFVLKDTVGTPIVEYESLDTARKVIDLYKQKSGIDVSVREPGVEPTPPPGPTVPAAPKVELKVGNRKFASVDDILAEKKKHTDEIAKINVFKNNPELLVKEAKAQGVAPGVYAKDLDIKIAKNQAQVSKYDQYINSLQQPPAEPVKAPAQPIKAAGPLVTPKTEITPEAVAVPEVATQPSVEAIRAKEQEIKADTLTEVEAPEQAATEAPEVIGPAAIEPEMPIGAVEMPIEESRVLPDEIVDSETKPTPIGVQEEAPTQTVKRPSATDEQLTALKVEMFGEPLGYRQMTPEQLAAYEAERDKRFPPQDVNVPLSAGITGQTAPRNMREAAISGPVVKDYSPETQEWMSKVYTGLMNRLTPIVPTEATVNLQTLIDQGPGYLIRGQARPEQTPDGMKTVIDLSTGILKPGMSVEDAINTLADTMNHEIIHVLRDKGVIRPSEWNILSRAATNTNVPGKKYTYLDKAQAIYAPIGPNGEPVPMAEIYANPDAVVEEAVAEMYRNWVKDRAKPPQPTVGLFNRITEFFRRIFQTLRNARHQDVFEAIQSGEIGSREGEGRERESMFSAAPVEIMAGYQDENGVHVRPFPEDATTSSTAYLRQGFKRFKGKGRYLDEQWGRALDEAFLNKFGRTYDINDPADYAKIVDAISDEVRLQMQQAQSGVGWYDSDIQDVFDELAKSFPILKDPADGPSMRQMFTVIAGVMSNGMKAKANVELAAINFAHFLRTGSFSPIHPFTNTGWNQRSNIMGPQIAMLNRMINDPMFAPRQGSNNPRIERFEKFLRFMFTEHSVREINAFRARHGTRSPAKIGKFDDRRLGMYAFGPKFGPFILNLNGLSDETVDSWASRSFYRHMGRSIGPDGQLYKAPLTSNREAMKRALRDVGAQTNLSSRDIQAVLWFYEKELYNQLGQSNPLEVFSDGAREFTRKYGPRTAGPSQPRTGREGEISRSIKAAGTRTGQSIPRGKRFSAAPAVESDEFKRWFGRSKIVNPNGSPKVVYHGTKTNFKSFDTGSSELGAHFGTPEQAAHFVERDPETFTNKDLGDDYTIEGRTDQVFPVYINLQNPIRLKDEGAWGPKRTARQLRRAGVINSAEEAAVPFDTNEGIKYVQGLLQKKGYDGIVYLNRREGLNRNPDVVERDDYEDNEFKFSFPEAQDSYIVFEPTQVKSVFNKFEEGAAMSTRFSAAPLPPYVERQNESLFAPTPKISYRDMMFDWFFGHRNTGKTLQTMNGTVDISKGTMAGLSAKSAVVDKNAYLTHLESLLNEQQTGNFQRMQADYSATAALAWRRRSGHLTASMMLRGKLEINFERPGDIQSATMKVTNDPDSLKEIFKVMTEPGPEKADGTPTTKADIFKSYAVALRGEWLRSTGQNVPAAITPQYIRETVDFTRREYPDVVEAYNKYQRFNKNLLTAAKDAGIISQAELGRLTNQMNYYGFIYEAYGEPLGPSSSQKTASKFKLRPYTGTEYGGLSNDPMFVMIQNAQFWVDSIAKNLAATKAYNVAKLMGEARPLRSDESPVEMSGEAKDIMYYSEGGVVKKFAVKDPLLVAALGSDDRIDVGKFWQVLGVPAHVLRESVTRDPAFMARNLMRDTVAAWMNSGVDFVPVIDTIKGFTTALKGGASFEALSARGVVGSYDLAMMGPQEIADTFRRNAMPLNVHTVASVEGGTAAIRSLWNRLGTISEASDAATRIAVYDTLKAQGVTDAEAAMQAIELLDFTRRGGSQTLSILTKLIPFLNARIQGMDVLYQAGRSGIRTATGGNRGERDANLGKKFLIRGGMLAALSVALEMLNDDDEDYKQLDNYIKEGNLLIPLKEFGLEGQFLAIPKPFENGLLFSTIPQQIYKTMSGDASVRDNVNLFFGQMSSTFGVNPIPQAILPPIEMITNHNFYTGLPLISEGKQRLAPELQYNTNTSQIAMMLGSLPIYYDFTTGRFGGMSPIMIDKLISGYGGPIGTYLVQGTSLAMQDFQIGPERMPIELSNAPVIRSFFVDAKSKNPKVVTQAYELFRVADEANRTYSRLKQMGDAEALVEYVDANRDILSYKKYIFSLTDRLNKLSAQERAIERDSSMTAEEKIEAQRRLRDIRIRLSAQVFEINKKLGR